MQSPQGSPRMSPMSRSPGLSPSFRHTRLRSHQSPVELKEKMRQSYKKKLMNSRHTLLNNLRNSFHEADMRSSLTLMLRDMFVTDYNTAQDDEEHQVIEMLKEELIQAETDWLLEQYETFNLENFDWSSMENNDDIICFTCQKVNLVNYGNSYSCPTCHWTINTSKTRSEIKSDASSAVETHNQNCSHSAHFMRIVELNEEHIFLICEKCFDMRLIL